MTLAEITERTKVSETQIGRWCNQEYGGLLEGEVPETGRYTQNLQGDIDFSG